MRFIIISFFLLNSLIAIAQQTASVKNEALQLKKLILQNHFNARPVNDTYSSIVFHHFLNVLDPERLYFTQEDITALSQFKYKIDDDLTGTSWNFLPAVTQRFKQSLLRTEGIIIQNTKAPFDVFKNEVFIADTSWAPNEKSLADRWYKNLKFETLNVLIRLQKRTPEVPDKDFISKKEAEARLKAQRNKVRVIQRILNHAAGYESHIASQFLQSVSLSFDPHSSYLSFAQMENFLASVSTEGYYFGISVDENDRGEIIIAQLTPGGPAWKSGEVHTGDVIQQIRWEGSDWIDVDGMTKQEFSTLLDESVKNSLEFTLIKAGGIERTVRLRKEKMSTDENRVKSFILEGERKIGYVSLPGFYSDWGDNDGSQCANDVATEILKLKKENIDGLMLDVRYNGGGSLKEAVAMAGIFIDAGPMGVLKEKSGAIISEKDMNRGTVYDGPLVLLVNGFSASASEFLAAALQDYHRGIIVGSKTYGKATGQQMFALEDNLSNKKSGWGYTTITNFKIYRVTGKTAQQLGIHPDIALPDLYDSIDFGEAYLEGALSSDSISKKIYYTPLRPLPLDKLKQKSEVRVKNNSGFQQLIRCSASLAGLNEKFDSVSLNWPDYKKLVNNEGKEFESLAAITEKPTSTFKIGHHFFDRERMKADDYVRQVNEVWSKNLLTDISLEEAYSIICDYIKEP
ncbi:carboxy terminal-processing peptidase [Chryseolinea sp. H1M3-3]|uniref:carboxy terminal-processing peptidase n=1 Tax=Chryseolinea sp. H1M3-3 TaxID=3034144 RepID=UPI0023EB2C64|nr:carboxy terminal-processing peptidase [Chryseolinea sp. H1M3-3]